jgi:hypothetical protein
MRYKVIKICIWASIPVLLASGIFTPTAGSSADWLTIGLCLCAMVAVGLALRQREYFLAAGLVSVAVVFSPVLLITKIFLLMTLTGGVTLLTLIAAFRPTIFHGENDIST